MKIRGFEVVDESKETILPMRQTKASAGYDFYVLEDTILLPGESKVLPTNVKAYMQEDEVLMLYARSSLAIKRGLILQNITGIIDSDFYPCEIKIAFRNTLNEPVELKKGERCAQGIFMKYLTSDNGNLDNLRSGGIGSTKK